MRNIEILTRGRLTEALLGFKRIHSDNSNVYEYRLNLLFCLLLSGQNGLSNDVNVKPPVSPALQMRDLELARSTVAPDPPPPWEVCCV